MTYREVWQGLTALYGEGEAKAIADYLLDVRFGMTKADILCGGVEALSSQDESELNAMLMRLQKAEPVQYVLGQAEFRDRKFRVCSGVLIPRPETEELCEWIMSEYESKEGIDVLDICTGSGCIAVSLALDMKDKSNVHAWDISDEALAIAKENAKTLNADVHFEKRDALSLVPETCRWDIIVSNPPYICNKEKESMSANVIDYEPSIALFVPDSSPLLFYKAISDYAASSLKKGGNLYFEINPIYVEDIKTVLISLDFTDIEVKEDMLGKQRMMKACMGSR
ncbi:MAG: peptide chain release factor N(5)-glutamine methyltransferase [Prevotellaceae bacterium]|nr:peptide chain release factor N(5)-glutamine methyltransferase [Prevotellaceae bacterium]